MASEERPGRAPAQGAARGEEPQDLQRERLLKEQELSVERQREGRGWSELPTQQDEERARASAAAREEGGPTPGAATAEHRGQARRPREAGEGKAPSAGRSREP